MHRSCSCPVHSKLSPKWYRWQAQQPTAHGQLVFKILTRQVVPQVVQRLFCSLRIQLNQMANKTADIFHEQALAAYAENSKAGVCAPALFDSCRQRVSAGSH